MNVGDFVRTKKGIAKIIGKLDNERFSYPGAWVTDTYLKIYDDTEYIYDEDIIKSSPQIIDLIEVGDFITYKQGNFYWNVFEQVSARYNRENQMTDLIVDNKPLNTVEILTVITHEQMEAMQYRVEE